MDDQVLVDVREKLAQQVDLRRQMNKRLGIIWAVGGSLVLAGFGYIILVAIFVDH